MVVSSHRACPLCGNPTPDELGWIHLPQISGSPLPDGYRLVACTPCDFAYADTPAPQSAYDTYYRTQAKYGGPTGTGGGIDVADRQRLDELADRLTAWLPGHEARVLDIGCGAGGLLQTLQRRGYTHAEGIDPDPAAAQAARQRGLTVHTGLAAETPTVLAGRQFDLIVLSHVAEHLRDFDAFDHLPALLAPGGTLYVEVPDPRHYRCGERPPLYYVDSEHINHFSPHALARLFSRMGLQPRSFTETPLTLADGTSYPALAGIAGAATGDTGATPAPDMLPRLRDYLADSLRRTGSAWRIAPPLGPGPVLVWGAGSWAQRLTGQGAIPIQQVCAFLDNAPNKQGLTFAGKPIVSPAEGLSRHPDAQVLVCVAVNPTQIVAELQRLEPGHPRIPHFFTDRA